MARLITSGNELLDATGEGWTTINTDGVNPFPAINIPTTSPGARKTPQGNGGRGYFTIQQNQRFQRFLFDPTNPEGPAITPSELYGRFAFHGNSNTGGTRTIMNLVDSNFNIMAEIIINDVGGGFYNVQLYKGDVYGSPAGTLLCTAATTAANSAWTLIEWHFKFSQVGGVAELRVNSGAIASFSGDVRGPVGGITAVSQLVFWQRTTNNSTANSYDDIVVNDTTTSFNNSWPGDGYIMLFNPAQDGALIPGGNKMTNERGTQTSNFSSAKLQPYFPGGGFSGYVNAQPNLTKLDAPLGAAAVLSEFNLPGGDRMLTTNPGAFEETGTWTSYTSPIPIRQVNLGQLSDYSRTFVAPNVSGDKDSYKLVGNLPLEVSGVTCVHVLSNAKTSDPRITHMRHLLEFSGPSEQQGPQRTIPQVAPAWVITSFNNNPQSGLAWTLADLNAIEFGVTATT